MRALTLILASFLTVLAHGQGKVHGPPPSPTAALAGTAIHWVSDAPPPVNNGKTRRAPAAKANLTKALELAKAADRPILWYIPTLAGSPMDRKPELDRYMMAGPWSSPEIIALANRRTIPLKGQPSTQDAEKLGLKAGAMIEPAIVLMRPDGSLAFSVDRLTTHHAGWLGALLDRELKKLGKTGRPSDAALAAKDPIDRAEALLDDGDLAGAAEALKSAPKSPRTSLAEAKLSRRLGALDGALTALGAAESLPEAALEKARVLAAKEDWAGAADAARKAASNDGAPLAMTSEARLLLGMALYRGGHHTEARKVWSQLAASAPKDSCAWKAASEAEGHGPFARGFEELGALPEGALLSMPLGTMNPKEAKDYPWLTQRSVRYLLEMQEDDGSFIDSQYDFGGRDSLPDVYMACTALAATALLEWRDVDLARCDAAIARAWTYLADESHSASSNDEERMWNHSYRILFMCRWLELGAPNAPAVKAKLQEVVKLAEAQQKQGGIWAHEYPNPFVSATVLHALRTAMRAGVVVNPGALKAGEDAVAGTRDDQGRFSYSSGGKGERNETFAAGRMPACELALLLGGKATQDSLKNAINKAFEHQAAYEAVRKYDDHAPPHRIGGFFFYWDLLGRGFAINAVSDASARSELNMKQRALVTSLAEFDGRFLDSHELGKPYGTAMALLIMKLCNAPAP